MNLEIAHEQKRSLFGAIEYALHVQLHCSPEELDIIDEHKLGQQRLFEVPEVETYKQAAQNCFDRSSERSIFNSQNAGRIILDDLGGLFNTARAHFSFGISVSDAIEGTSISSPNLRELTRCEQLITEAFDALAQDVYNANHFSTGHERLYEPEGVPEPEIITPADWTNRQQWWRR